MNETSTQMYEDGAWYKRVGIGDPGVREVGEAYIAEGRSPFWRRVRRCCICTWLWCVKYILRADHIWLEEVS